MPYSAPLAYEDHEHDAATPKWVVIFILLSILTHALIIATFILLSRHLPVPKMEPTASSPTVSLTLVQPPPAPPQPKHIFMPTPAQANAQHKDALVESDHDTRLASQSKTARKPDTIMPDVVSKATHATSLDSSPSSPPTQKPQGPVTPPTQQAKQAPTPPQPPQPQQPPQPKAQPQKTPPSPSTQPPPPTPAPTPQPKTPPPPAVDANGLPVLPMLNAPTMAPQTSASQQPQTAPPPVMPIVPANLQGMAGISGQPTPEAMKTDLGQYKARFYQAVGSRWYSKLTPQQIQLIGVGSVDIQYTIFPDGTITTKVLQSGGGSMQILLTISRTSILETSPFLPFPPSMLKDYPNGYTDDFSFSIY